MPVSAITVELRVRVAWWLRLYLTSVTLLHCVGVALDFGSVARVIDRAITMSIGGSRFRHVWSNRLV